LFALGLTRKTYLFCFSLINVDFSVNEAVLIMSCGSFILLRRRLRRRRPRSFRQFFPCLRRNENFLNGERLLCVHIGGGCQSHWIYVAGGLIGFLVGRIGNDEHLLRVGLFFEQIEESFGFPISQIKLVDGENIACVDVLDLWLWD